MKVAVYPVTSETDDLFLAQSLCEKFGFADYERIGQYDVVILVDYHSGIMDELTAKVTVGGDAKVVLIKSDAVASFSRENDDEFHLITLSMQEKINLMDGDAGKLLEISFLKSDMELRLPKK